MCVGGGGGVDMDAFHDATEPLRNKISKYTWKTVWNRTFQMLKITKIM